MNIIISGMTCSGKTTLAQDISKSCSEHAFILSQDVYFKDRGDLPKNSDGYYLYDNQDAFHVNEFISDIEKLFNVGYSRFPIYDVNNNKRIGYSTSLPLQDINVFEGLHTIELLKDKIENPIKIYMDTSIEECLRRRILRDSKYRISEKEIIDYFNEIMLPQYKKYIYPQRDDADYVVRNKEEKDKVLELIRR